ncbi:hypothetical protein OsJ_13828 [Oryza sativa Japonica Group]|uniref:F-box domain-containing protein n=1 Tax=Oryza sativa subsp. japonica TaxID=39947 RepID=B9FDP4_ORYSJ|nr:hypothetical protein OsJ_13828 [Oryza sativa Japonica Group]
MKQPYADDDGDRLSALPDCLLHTVMSFLSARQAVRTFRLHLPNFQRITATQQHHGRQMERWILRGFRYRPAALEIAVGVAAVAFKLPLLGTSSASRLKRLHLSGVVLDGGFGECIRSWCPVLEAMELKACIFEDLKEIVSSTIKSLAIVDCRSGHHTDALVCRMDSLVEASISGTRFGSDFDKTTSTLIGSLINVRELNVSWFQPVNTPNLKKVILQNCEISGHSRKRKRTPRANRNQIHSKRRSLITSKSEISKIMKMTYEDDGVSDLIELLLRNWRKLEDHTIIITKI